MTLILVAAAGITQRITPGASSLHSENTAAISVDTSATYTLTARHSGKALDVKGWSTADGAAVDQWTGNASAANQQWRFTDVGGGYYRLTSVNSAKALDVAGVSTSDGATVQQWSVTGGDNQAWSLQDAGSGYVTLVARHSGKALDVVGAATNDGALVDQWSRNGGANQQWKLTEVGASTSGPVGPVGPGVVTGDVAVHDPSMVKRPDGTYVLMGTAPGLSIRTSPDRTAFSYRGVAFPGGAPWTDAYTHTANGNLWAPDISYHNGKFYLYYAASSFGSNYSAIFLATSPSAMPGTWTNQGKVIETNSSNDYNAIDPNLFVGPDGRWWLTMGSFWSGIKQIELDRNSGQRLNNSITGIAFRPGSTAEEAPVVFRHGNYYYLFLSFDLCCQGSNSTYRVMVGRSSNVSGPYYDRNGTAMTNGGGTQILATNGRYVGPGGQSVITDSDSDLIVYHYYDALDNGNAKLGINLLGWDSSDWPYVH